jgi:uncharacterized protein HemY
MTNLWIQSKDIYYTVFPKDLTLLKNQALLRDKEEEQQVLNSWLLRVTKSQHPVDNLAYSYLGYLLFEIYNFKTFLSISPLRFPPNCVIF